MPTPNHTTDTEQADETEQLRRWRDAQLASRLGAGIIYRPDNLPEPPRLELIRLVRRLGDRDQAFLRLNGKHQAFSPRRGYVAAHAIQSIVYNPHDSEVVASTPSGRVALVTNVLSDAAEETLALMVDVWLRAAGNNGKVIHDVSLPSPVAP